jgi:hypothetical protein
MTYQFFVMPHPSLQISARVAHGHQMILLTNHTRNESTTDRYSDMMMQKTMTTVVDPIVSALVGNETFFNSPRTSVMKARIESVMRLNISPSDL